MRLRTLQLPLLISISFLFSEAAQSFDAEKWAAENRAAALLEQAEADAELAKYAQEKREEYKSKAIRYQSTSRGGVTIDSFELPGDVFVACTLSFPGPVYSCDETGGS